MRWSDSWARAQERHSNTRRKRKAGQREMSKSRGQHFELVACRQLLMLAYMAWVGVVAMRDAATKGSSENRVGTTPA